MVISTQASSFDYISHGVVFLCFGPHAIYVLIIYLLISLSHFVEGHTMSCANMLNFLRPFMQ